jgi:hypothetical protein
LRSKRDAVEYLRHGNSTGDAPTTLEPARNPENEEWSWMVDEDPAFYLRKSGRAQDNPGG